MYQRGLNNLVTSPARPLPGSGARSFPLKLDNPTKVLRCVVVDDNVDIMWLVGEMLAVLGHQVDLVSDGARAISKIKKGRYDLAVIDLDMHRMNGHLLASKIKEASENTKTVIMTERCHAEVFDLMAVATADAWLFKPFGMRELSQAAQLERPQP